MVYELLICSDSCSNSANLIVGRSIIFGGPNERPSNLMNITSVKVLFLDCPIHIPTECLCKSCVLFMRHEVE